MKEGKKVPYERESEETKETEGLRNKRRSETGEEKTHTLNMIIFCRELFRG
jgi:hypothetical protein